MRSKKIRKNSVTAVSILLILAFSACGGGKKVENVQTKDTVVVVKPEKTIANLQTAIINESNASAKYKVLALVAEREKLKNVAKMFEAASFAEQLHASSQSVWLSLLKIKLVPEVETPMIQKDIKTNIQIAIQTQTAEFSNVYPSMIEDAKAENQEKAAQSFTFAMEAKKKHVELYAQALKILTEKKNDKTISNQWYVCPRCGCLFNDITEVETCIICGEMKRSFRKF